MNYFTFDGIDSRTYNTYIATSNAFDAPGREDEVIKVPGSNNIYYLTEGTYKPFDIKLYCYIPSNMQVKTDDLRNFLLSKGTCRYTEAIRPNEFRVARFIEAYELDVSDRVSAAFVLTFKAQPQRYLTTNTPITTTATADTTTDTTLSLSTVPTPINISLNGNTTQEGSSGKNLFGFIASDFTGAYGSANYVEITGLTEGTYYTCSTNAPTGYIWFGKNANYSEGTVDFPRVYQGNPITVQVDSMRKITVGILASDKTTALSYKTQIEKGSTATAYEPHISPTNPQPIHNVSGDNTVFVSGKNMWGGTKMVSDIKKALPSATADFTNNIITFLSSTDGNINPSLTPDVIYKTNTDYTLILSISGTSASNSTNMLVNYTNGAIEYINKPQAIAEKQVFAFHPNRQGRTIKNIAKVWMNGTSTIYANECGLFEGNINLEDFEVFGAQSYPLYLPVENLLPRRTTRTTNGVTFTVNADGSISTSGTATANIYNALATLNLPNGTYTMTGSAKGGSTSTYYMYTEPHYRGDTGNGVTFTDIITSCSIFVASGQNMDGKVFKPQIEKGSKANHYTPYSTTPIELNKIGTYQDYIYKNGGKWYVHKEINKLNLGTITTWAKSSSGNKYYTTITPLYKWASNDVMLCDSYIFDGIGDGTRGYYGANGTFRYGYNVTSSSPYSEIYFTNESISTLADFKTSMSGVFLYYPIRTSTNTEITDTTLINQLNNIEKAYSYNGTTNILQVSNDNGFMLSVLSLHANNVSSTYKGEPIITVNSTGLIYFNGCVIKVNQAPMTINSQTMQAYNGVVNLNNYIEANDFPMIEAGTNVIGSEMPLSIVPNYWKL